MLLFFLIVFTGSGEECVYEISLKKKEEFEILGIRTSTYLFLGKRGAQLNP